MGRDQNDTAARIVHHGAGVRLSPSSPAGKIGDAVLKLLESDSYRANAQRLATAIIGDAGCADLVDEVESVARVATPC